MNIEATEYASLQVTDLDGTVSYIAGSSWQKYHRDNYSRFQKCADTGSGFHF